MLYYIVTIQNIINIAGPFPTSEDAVSYGRNWQEENNDDPRWQELICSDLQVNFIHPAKG